MNRYKDLQGMPLQAGEASPFMGRLIDVERVEKGVFVSIPFDMLDNAGIARGKNKVEVWGDMDGTIRFRIATRCEICGRGSRLYEIDMGFAKKQICAEDYLKLVGKYPEEAPNKEIIR
ncbi:MULTISPECIES: hypothetical protein [Bacillus cereus group]|uniref:Uncharacterized protein n=1 Tax=Bacillus cereus TaxID=1396 RepID=A0AAW5L9L4_BACCE|nr:hypothetical protein [Bacillus cereus]MCQ6288909.1 hypothetical protein [Bacillus cereus]MCQ6318322.1 hypothetical protein [Bacillus cereus]MCQ6325523.1 hypothetical protein [Bacillus cereus]MCQ6386000.1 hypothetical protein [Bacillus cereus]